MLRIGKGVRTRLPALRLIVRLPIATADLDELAMTTFNRTKLAAALAASALTALLAAPVAAQTSGHDHGAAATSALSLNQGQKWSTDEPLRDGMDRIRGLVEPQLSAAHAGKLGPRQYQALAKQIESQVGAIVANCKLEPKAD